MNSEADVRGSPVRGPFSNPEKDDPIDPISNPPSTDINADEDEDEGRSQPPVDETDEGTAETLDSEDDA